MPSIEQNYHVWDRDYSWREDGDEWTDQAAFCAQLYPAWKRALVDEFMFPYISPDSAVLEIGPGHGRWTQIYIDKVKHVSLIDLSPTCIEHCRRRFQSFNNVAYYVNDGKTLRSIDDKSIDFIWSYDVFVHVELNELRRYLAEFTRVLKGGGVAVIHHSNAQHSLSFLAKVLLVNMSGPLRTPVTNYLFGRYGNMGRSFVSSRMVKSLAARAGLRADIQTDTWGQRHEYNCKKFSDEISVLRLR
jgi:ubiquinone/menaquinone biosynthesis C-methylase UbiE